MQKKKTKNVKIKKKIKEANNNIIKVKKIKNKAKPKKAEIIYTSEIIAKIIFDKILTNVYNEIKLKKLEKLINLFSSNNFIKQITNFISLSFVRYENDKNASNDESNIIPPSPGQLDNWKIHRINIVKYHKRKSAKINTNKNISNKILTKSRFRMSKSNTIRNSGTVGGGGDTGGEIYDIIEKNRDRMKSLKYYDSFPSFPLSENLFKHETYLTKEQEKEVELYRKEMKIKEENKKKREQVKRRFAIFDGSTHRDETNNNKYKNKNIGVTTKGEIIFIKSLDVKNLMSDFIEITTKMKEKIKKEKRRTTIKDKNNILKEKEQEIEFNSNILIENKKRANKQIIIGGSPFENFKPEPGVNLIENNETKSGGNDFENKYKRLSFEQFKKTLEQFQKANNEKNKIIEIQKESEILSPISRNNSNSNNPIMNSQIPIMRNTLYNFSINNNNINDLKKTFERSSSLPELFSSSNINSRNSNDISLINKNIGGKTYNDNDLMIKNSFNFMNNNSQMHNFIKTSSSFQKLIFNDDKESKDNNNKNIFNKIMNNTPSTERNFFINFNRNYKFFSKNKNGLNSLKKKRNIYDNILNNIDLGTKSQEIETNYINEIPKINIVKNIKDKNILRVRSNLNEIYNQKMNILNKLTLRRNESDINFFNKLKTEKKQNVIYNK